MGFSENTGIAAPRVEVAPRMKFSDVPACGAGRMGFPWGSMGFLNIAAWGAPRAGLPSASTEARRSGPLG